MTDTLTATLRTNQGTVVVRLLPDHAPKTVRNFVELAEGGRQWTDPATGQATTGRLYDDTIFGEVIDGAGVVDKISRVKTGSQDRPVEDVTLESVTVERGTSAS